VVDPGEQCDDGNATDCDGCSARCTREVVGNGVIDTECGEVCDGDDVAGQTRPGGTVTCAPDCRRVDRSRCPANAPAPREICGNCIDDDLNGLVDFEDPACCAASVAGKLAKARLKARANGRTLLRLRGSLGGAELAASSTTEDVFLQVRTQPGAELLCAEVPAGRFERLRHAFRFRDRTHTVPSARSLDLPRLHRGPQGALHARALGRAMPLDMPHPGTVQVMMGFADPAATQCAPMKAPLRPARAACARPEPSLLRQTT